MKGGLRDEAYKIVAILRLSGLPTSPADRGMVFEELCKVYNTAMEEAKKQIESAMEDSGDGMPIVERLTYYAKPFVRNEARRDIINKLEKLKVKP